ncbi:hypothetical protein BDN70DRAFT_991980 [Pholiota conissans]|uniref:DUF6593 domain-containing protein n=1 Tax=Pholiota conissans TaxID=109636 RepID=A0A9P5Z724_9AGAR|nr:hypothetical protein BDN70DRAFT_991980 [Pholiota conissans]
MFSSDSQTTLVSSEQTTELTLSTKSILNTLLLTKGKPSIAISTVDPAGAVTKIINLATGQLLATIKRRTFLPDVVKFEQLYNGEPLKIREWLLEVKISGQYTKWIVNTPSGTFVWHVHKIFRLALFPENDSENPIAWLQLDGSFSLVLKRSTEGFRDEIITSFVILEQQMRLEEKKISKANGVGEFTTSLMFGRSSNVAKALTSGDVDVIKMFLEFKEKADKQAKQLGELAERVERAEEQRRKDKEEAEARAKKADDQAKKADELAKKANDRTTKLEEQRKKDKDEAKARAKKVDEQTKKLEKQRKKDKDEAEARAKEADEREKKLKNKEGLIKRKQRLGKKDKEEADARAKKADERAKKADERAKKAEERRKKDAATLKEQEDKIATLERQGRERKLEQKRIDEATRRYIEDLADGLNATTDFLATGDEATLDRIKRRNLLDRAQKWVAGILQLSDDIYLASVRFREELGPSFVLEDCRKRLVGLLEEKRDNVPEVAKLLDGDKSVLTLLAEHLPQIRIEGNAIGHGNAKRSWYEGSV